ncbi:MAG TPA: hypothetical protein VJB63_04110 [Patescibacteria group bacterium]|nr:hypothetical protein [Patescibacteria group bacterium]
MNTKNNTADIFAKSVRHTLWIHSFLCAAIIYILLVEYLLIQNKYLTVSFLNEALAGTASIMIGTSFAFSGFCYYFDFLDRKIAYRKYFGLVGFWGALLYAIILAILHPQKYIFGLSYYFWSVDIIFGGIALGIFAVMAIISTRSMMMRLGVHTWRRILRMGYLALVLLIIRAVVVESALWRLWFVHPYELPPLRLVGTVFSVIVLLFRGSMIVSQFFYIIIALCAYTIPSQKK